MVVSSSKGTILPTVMAELAVDNGYRTASNGTAWSYFSFVADYFDFDEFYTTYSFSTMTDYLTQTNSDGSSKYYVIASCGPGLFTTGGHYIVLVADTDSTITVYDPYLYDGKFTTSSRKSAGVVVSGNSAYVTETAFKKYANYKCFWVFSNDQGEGNPNATASTTSSSSTSSSSSSSSKSSTTTTTVSYTRYVSTSSKNLNVRTGAGTSYSVKISIAKGTKVTVTKVKGNWSYITSPVKGWVSTQYLSSSKVTTTSSSSSSSTSKSTSTSSSSSYTTGTYKVTASLLNVRTGAGTSYSKKTYSQLTANARKQNKVLGNYYANGYLKGVVCTVTQVKGNWGKTASGWICLDYCIKQ